MAENKPIQEQQLRQREIKTVSRRKILESVVKTAIVLSPIAAIIAALETPEEAAERIGRKYREQGTPTPSPEWKISEELLRNSAVRIGLTIDKTTGEWISLGSAGVIDGATMGRKDINLVWTATHNTLKPDGTSRFDGVVLRLYNGIKDTYCEVESGKYSVVRNGELDTAVIAFRRSNAIADPKFFEGIITQVETNWTWQEEILLGGYNTSFRKSIGQNIPVITRFKPNFIRNVYGAYTFSGEGHAPGSSGSPALNKNGAMVGILVSVNDITLSYGIAPIPDFVDRSKEAIEALV